MSVASAASEQQAKLRRWFFEDALPFWWTIGTDRALGGFFEKIAEDLTPIDVPRRARLVSRQIYVYSIAHELGWNGPCAEIVNHGLEFLTGRMIRDDGTVISSVQPDGSIVRGEFDSYDYAFVLFGLAAAARRLGDKQALSCLAVKIRDRMIEGWSHPVVGFQESRPPSIPLKANPHMHLLEAFLAWAELGLDGKHEWDRLADSIVGLCLSRFVDPASGAVREYFDLEWKVLADEHGQIVVEPGHQFEWAWLLLRWADLRGRPDVVPVALRLVEIGEKHGVDPVRGIAINELLDDLTPRDARARLWPQTERIKAWYMMAKRAENPADRGMALDKLAQAIAGLRLFFASRPAGLWAETIREDGSHDSDPARASSLYHIACAIRTIDDMI